MEPITRASIGTPAWENQQAIAFLPLVPVTRHRLYPGLAPADGEDCEAMMRAAMVRALRAWREDGGKSVRSWVIEWMRGAAKEYVRRRWQEKNRPSEFGIEFVGLSQPNGEGEPWLDVADPQPDPEEALIAKEDETELWQRIGDAIGRLDPLRWSTIVRYYFCGMSMAEIAQEDDRWRTAIGQRKVTAEHRLRVMLLSPEELREVEGRRATVAERLTAAIEQRGRSLDDDLKDLYGELAREVGVKPDDIRNEVWRLRSRAGLCRGKR